MSTFDAAQVMKALEARGLARSYPTLAVYQSNIAIRERLIKKCRHEWEDTLRDLLARLGGGQELDRDLLRRLHVEQLEFLAHICMFVEDFSYVAYLLKHRPRSLDRSAHFTGRMRTETLDDLMSLSARSIRTRFRFPVIAKMRLGDHDATLVADVLRRCIAGLEHDLRTVSEFVGHGYFDVYNEYKHTFDILLGLGTVEGHNVHTHIYARVAPQQKKHRPEKTLILDASPDAIRRYDAVFGATTNLMNVLVQNTLSWMVYNDGRYLVQVPISYEVPEDLLVSYGQLVEQYALGWAVRHSVQLQVGFSTSASRAIEKALRERGVAERSGSIFSRRSSTSSSLAVRRGSSPITRTGSDSAP